MTGTPATLIGTYKPKSKRGIFLGVLSFLVVVGLAAVGYFFIYPMFAVTPGAPEVVVTPPTPPEPTPPAPEAPPVTEPIPPAPTPPPETIAGIDAHTSLFSVPADIKADVTVTPIEIEALRAALPANPVSVPLLKEVVIKTEEGKVVAFGAFASRLVPGFFTAELAASFADDATYFTYSNGDGTWFGLAVQLKNGANLGALQEKMSAFQHDPDNDNFFLANPGAQGVWRDGTIKGRPASLADFATSGATLGYVWLDRTLLITTNAAAGEEAARRLGF